MRYIKTLQSLETGDPQTTDILSRVLALLMQYDIVMKKNNDGGLVFTISAKTFSNLSEIQQGKIKSYISYDEEIMRALLTKLAGRALSKLAPAELLSFLKERANTFLSPIISPVSGNRLSLIALLNDIYDNDKTPISDEDRQALKIIGMHMSFNTTNMLALLQCLLDKTNEIPPYQKEEFDNIYDTLLIDKNVDLLKLLPKNQEPAKIKEKIRKKERKLQNAKKYSGKNREQCDAEAKKLAKAGEAPNYVKWGIGMIFGVLLFALLNVVIVSAGPITGGLSWLLLVCTLGTGFVLAKSIRNCITVNEKCNTALAEKELLAEVKRDYVSEDKQTILRGEIKVLNKKLEKHNRTTKLLNPLREFSAKIKDILSPKKTQQSTLDPTISHDTPEHHHQPQLVH